MPSRSTTPLSNVAGRIQEMLERVRLSDLKVDAVERALCIPLPDAVMGTKADVRLVSRAIDRVRSDDGTQGEEGCAHGNS